MTDEPERDAEEELAPPGEAVLVAVDFTATELRLILAEPDGAPIERERWPLPALADEEGWAWEIGGRISTCFVREGQRRSALAIVVASPGIVDPLSGRLLRSTGQESWDGLSVADALRRHFDAPVAAENRTVAALAGEAWQGAAAGVDDALYISLRGVPAAAAIVGGRPVRGAHFEAGSLPAVPELDPEQPLAGEDLEHVAGLLADAAALLDPSLVLLDAEAQHLEALTPLLQRVLDRVAPGPKVLAGTLGASAPLVGAVRLAISLSYEGGREQ